MIRFTLLIAALCLAVNAYGWSKIGHRIICEIAFQELTDAARDEVIRLIRLDSEFGTLRDACTWADHPRRRAPEHYITYPRDTLLVSDEECVMADTCAFSGITTDLAVLEDRNAADADKLRSLKLIGHWVGDLHQPLHVSFADDALGNRVKVIGGACEGNFHYVWGECILRQEVLGVPQWGWRVRNLAGELRATVSVANREDWNRSQISVWANESFQVTIAPQTGYCDIRNGSCIYDIGTNREVFTEDEDEKRVIVDRSYIETNAVIIEERLIRAGVRLAGLLNHAFAAS